MNNENKPFVAKNSEVRRVAYFMAMVCLKAAKLRANLDDALYNKQ